MDYKNLEMLSWLVGQLRKAGEVGITFDELIDRCRVSEVRLHFCIRSSFTLYYE